MELVLYFGGWVEGPRKQTNGTDGGWVQSTFGAKAEQKILGENNSVACLQVVENNLILL